MIRTHRTLWLLSAALILSLSGALFAQAPRGGRGIYGDWLLEMDFEGRTMESILVLTPDRASGGMNGQWISFWGVSDISDIQLENGDLKFEWSVEGFGGQGWTSRFSGEIEDGALTGTLSGDRGDLDVTGKRMPRMPRAVGHWEMKYRVGDRDVTSVLKITSDAERNLSGAWESEWGEHEITEISADRGQLTFKRHTTANDMEFDSSFSGTMQQDGLTGTFTSERGDMDVTGTRVGADAIGTWVLDIEGEQGTRKQRLRVNRDLSALYGTIAVDAVTLDGQKISFPMELDFGDQPFEMSFQATLDGTNITGEVTSPRGARKVTGSRAARFWRGRPGQ